MLGGGDYTLRAAGLTTVLRLQVTEEASLRFNSYRSLNNYQYHFEVHLRYHIL